MAPGPCGGVRTPHLTKIFRLAQGSQRGFFVWCPTGWMLAREPLPGNGVTRFLTVASGTYLGGLSGMGACLTLERYLIRCHGFESCDLII